jgi:hypothetical protein
MVYDALADLDREKAAELDPRFAEEAEAEDGEEDGEPGASEEDPVVEGRSAAATSSRGAQQAPRDGDPGRGSSLKFQDLLAAGAAQIGDELELTYAAPGGPLPGVVVARLVSGSRNGLLLLDGAGVEIEEPSSSTGLLRQVLEAHGRRIPSVNGNLYWRFRTGASSGKTLWEAYEALRGPIGE